MSPSPTASTSKHEIISFASGAAYGFTSVLTAQPFDTIKTKMQAQTANARRGFAETALDLSRREGIRGLYRGGMPLFLGGALIRSAQFGTYDVAINALGGPAKHRVVFNILDPHVVLAGFAGGFGRGIVESPFEFAKVRRQVDQRYKLREIYKGSGVTVFRNSFLFCSFAIYMDLAKYFLPFPLTPFWNGALCANMAWLTIWPLDVLKSRRQSGLYENVSSLELLARLMRNGEMFRGVLPGLARSTVANGTGMFVYAIVQKELATRWH